jgi:hypothetical protein
MNKQAFIGICALPLMSIAFAGCSSSVAIPGAAPSSIGGMKSVSSLFGGQGAGAAASKAAAGAMGEAVGASSAGLPVSGPAVTGSIVPPREESEAVNWRTQTNEISDGDAVSAATGGTTASGDVTDGAEAGGADVGGQAQAGDELASSPDIENEEELSAEELHRRELINRGDLEPGQPLPPSE